MVWKRFSLPNVFPNDHQLKARANARNIAGPNMLRALAHHVVCCCVLLRHVGSCWIKFETGQTSEPTSANISIVSRSSKRGPTMLRSFAQHIQQCCAGARALHATHPHKYMRTRNRPLHSHLKTRHVVTCCERLHTSANMAQQETTMLAQQCCVLLRAFARAFIVNFGTRCNLHICKKAEDS